MNFWEKLGKDIQQGALTVSAKTSELLKSGAELVKEGAEKASAESVYASKLAPLNWEKRTIEKSMNSEFVQLGELFFRLKREGRVADLESEAFAHFDRLASLEKEMAENQKKRQAIEEEYEAAAGKKSNANEFQQNLHQSGGTIIQVAIEEDAQVQGKKLKEVDLPKQALIGTIIRKDDTIIPDGETEFLTGDKITILGKQDDVEATIELLTKKS